MNNLNDIFFAQLLAQQDTLLQEIYFPETLIEETTADDSGAAEAGTGNETETENAGTEPASE